FFGSGIIAVGESAGQEFVDGLLIARSPLRLIIGRVRPAHVRAFVPIDAEPTEAVQDWGQRLFDVSLRVRVVDPQNELAAVPACEEPVEKRRAHAANVQIARWAGGETSPDGARHGWWNDEGL